MLRSSQFVLSRYMSALTEENLAALDPGAVPARNERRLSNASVKSIEKALAKMGPEAMQAAQTTVVLGEMNRKGDVPLNRQASAIKAMEKTGTAKSATAEGGEPSGGGCCLVM